nr:hypothetical protein [uncultured Mediterranean phage uvMED]
MAIRGKEEEKKNGMKITDNMDGEKKADNKLMAKYQPGITSRELKKLPGDSIQEKIEKKLGIKVMPNITLEKAIELLNKNKDKNS